MTTFVNKDYFNNFDKSVCIQRGSKPDSIIISGAVGILISAVF